jgi:hypothetical protein
MLNKLAVTAAVIFLLIGSIILYGPISGPDTNQTGRILGGATLVSFGLMTLSLVFKDWLHWRRHYKNAHSRGHESMQQEESNSRPI